MRTVKKYKVVALAAALALMAPIVGCSSSSSGSSADGSSSSSASSSSSTVTEQSSDFDAVEFYACGDEATWRASVVTTGSSVYGDVAGSENMLDVVLNADGTCSVQPLEGHEDLLTGEGTWEGTEDTLTLTIEGQTIEISVTGSTSLAGDPTDFGIDGFDTLDFVLY